MASVGVFEKAPYVLKHCHQNIAAQSWHKGGLWELRGWLTEISQPH